MYPVLLRKFAWDVLPCTAVQKFMPVMDLIPASEEGAHIEHKESHDRLALQQPLQEQLTVYSAMAAKVIASMALRLDVGPEPPEVVSMVTGQFNETIHIGVSVILANLLDQGYLQLGPRFRVEAAPEVTPHV